MRFQKLRASSGDTIIEVLLAMVIVSAVLGSAFVVTNRSLSNARQSQEHEEALKVAESQLERIRNLASNSSSPIFSQTEAFCLNLSNTADPTVTPFNGSPAVTSLPTDVGNYPSACHYAQAGNGFDYYLGVLYDSASNLFTATVSWTGPTGGQELVTVAYKIYKGSSVVVAPPSEGSFTPPAPPPPPPVPPVVPPAACGTPRDIILVLDSSDSMDEKWKGSESRFDRAIKVAKDFVGNTGVSATGNHLGVVAFAENVIGTQALTGNVGQLTSFINGIDKQHGTRYLPPLNRATTMWSTQGRATANQILVFASDGLADDLPSASATRTAILSKTSSMKGSGVEIYTIGINTNDTSLLSILRDMATDSSHFADAKNADDLDSIMDDIAAKITCT